MKILVEQEVFGSSCEEQRDSTFEWVLFHCNKIQLISVNNADCIVCFFVIFNALIGRFLGQLRCIVWEDEDHCLRNISSCRLQICGRRSCREIWAEISGKVLFNWIGQKQKRLTSIRRKSYGVLSGQEIKVCCCTRVFGRSKLKWSSAVMMNRARISSDSDVSLYNLRTSSDNEWTRSEFICAELVMRRINESEVLAQLNCGHFLLCEKEFLFESRRKVVQLPLTSPLMSSFSSRLSYLPTRNAFTHEVGRILL